MRRQVVGWVLASLAVSVSGCQSWSQVAQGIPSGSRVPPPGTGTYQVPSSYYNNGAAAKSGAVSSNAQPAGGTNTAAAANNTTTASNTTANNTATARTASQALPTTGSRSGAPTTATTAQWQTPPIDQLRSDVNNTASAVFNNVATRANQVVQAGTARAAAAVEQYTDQAPSLSPAGAPPANLSATPANFAAPTTGSSSRPTSAATSRTLSDKAPAEEPQLDWQAPE